MIRISAFVTAAVLAVMSFVAPTPAAAAQGTPGLSFPIETSSAQGTFNGGPFFVLPAR